MAGIMGSNRASPRLSPSAMSAICWAAIAGSTEPKVENMAPAIAAPANDGLGLEGSLSLGVIRPFGRFLMEKREMGLDGLVEVALWALRPKHLAFSTAMVAIVAAI